MRYRIGLILIVFVIGLAACNLGAQQSTYNPFGCDKYSGVCVTIKAEKEFIEFGEMLPVTVTVTSEQDIPYLELSVFVGYSEGYGGKAYFPEQELLYDEANFVTWKLEEGIQKGQQLVFRGKVAFTQEGIHPVHVYAVNGPGLRVTNYFEVYFTENGGQVYYAGTKKPTRDVTDIILDNYPVITYTPGPSPTWAPSATWPAYIATREALTQQAEPKTPPTVGTMMVTQIVPSSPP